MPHLPLRPANRLPTRQLATRLLGRLDPERAHRLAIRALLLGLAGSARRRPDPALRVRAMGLDFANPIGLAAGFDKDGRVIRPLARLGFGFVEAGTVTPRPQPGNPRPRLFRLDEDGAVINRMGFNNQGIEACLEQLVRLERLPGVPVGLNVGINKTGAEPLRDYPALVREAAPFVDYLVINLSSPNTPGLRDLQSASWVASLLRSTQGGTAGRPLLIKLAPDLPREALADIVEAAVDGGAAGLIIGNTTIARPPGLRSRWSGEAGGLSGRPLLEPSTALLADAARAARGRLTLVGCGGIESAAHVIEKLRAGADLVQLYTGFVLHGPALIERLLEDLTRLLAARGVRSPAELKGEGL